MAATGIQFPRTVFFLPIHIFQLCRIGLYEVFISRTKKCDAPGDASTVTDPFETLWEQRERHLRSALRARDIAANAPNESVRERYLKLANGWPTLAGEVGCMHA